MRNGDRTHRFRPLGRPPYLIRSDLAPPETVIVLPVTGFLPARPFSDPDARFPPVSILFIPDSQRAVPVTVTVAFWNPQASPSAWGSEKMRLCGVVALQRRGGYALGCRSLICTPGFAAIVVGGKG